VAGAGSTASAGSAVPQPRPRGRPVGGRFGLHIGEHAGSDFHVPVGGLQKRLIGRLGHALGFEKLLDFLGAELLAGLVGGFLQDGFSAISW